jgi:TMEM175 potassium channel family protein
MSEAFERKETGRIEAFSDGVFAIAITLLVLTMKAPNASELGAGGLGPALLALWPHYLAFVTSFAIILDMWVNHHRIFTLVRRSDHVFLYWNGLLLLLITFLPFPTNVLAEYMLHPETTVAGGVFTGTVVMIALMFKGLWRYAAKDGRLLARNANPENVKQVTNQHRYGPIMYLAAFALSFVSTGASVALCLCLAVFFGFKGWPRRA